MMFAVVASPSQGLAASLSWDGGGGTTDWHTAANWTPDQVPTSADDVTINSSTPITVTTSADIAFNTLTIGGGTVANALKLTHNIATGGSITIGSNGTLEQNNLVQQAISGALTIQAGGILTHTANSTAQLYTVNFSAASIEVQTGGTLNATAKGFDPGSGPGAGPSGAGGGGGHGGEGGRGPDGGPGGSAYDDPVNPSQIGSGGGSGGGGGHQAGSPGSGGPGGGLVRLVVSGTLTLNGAIVTTGGGGEDKFCCPNIPTGGGGGGAGGSVKITANALAGAGSITANGGPGGQSFGSAQAGGGGGGRIAVICACATIPSTINRVAIGGAGGSRGGAGTIYLKNQNQTYGELVVDNGADLTTTPTPLTALGFTFDNLTISKASVSFSGDLTIAATTLNLDAGGGSLRLTGSLSGPTTLTLTRINMTVSALTTAMSALTVGPAASLTLTSSNAITVATLTVQSTGTIVGNLVINAADVTIASGGSIQTPGGSFNDYSDFKTPTTSGGGMRLDLTGTLTVNGSLTATGSTGGSIYVTTLAIAGLGSITVDGSSHGGKIAIHFATSNTFTGTRTAYGRSGSAGTIFIKAASQPNGDLVIDNGLFVASAITNLGMFTPALTLDRLQLVRARVVLTGNLILTQSQVLDFQDQTRVASLTLTSTLSVTGNLTLANGLASMIGLAVTQDLTIGPQFTLTHPAVGTAGLSITATNMSLDATSTLSATAKGFDPGSGPGAGPSGAGGGGGHGGEGGRGPDGGPGGSAYDDPVNPSQIGSGGGSGGGGGHQAGSPGSGGPGGGLVRLVVSGTLTLNGAIVTTGGGGEDKFCCPNIPTGGGGGGAGGSVKITANALAGAGSITANGGPGGQSFGSAQAGGGGGGRIAVRYGQATFPGLLKVRGGTGGNNGEAGTICFINLTTNQTTCAGPGGSGEATITQPPAASPVTAAPSFGAFVGSPFTLLTSFTDPESTVTSCEYTTDGTTFALATVSGSGPTYTCTQTGLIGANGQVFTLNMRATSAGGTGLASAIIRTVDALAPTTTDNAPAAWQPQDVTVTLTASDGPGAGVALTSFCTDPLNACTPAVVGTLVSITCPAASVCETALRYHSTDRVGNLESIRNTLVQIDKAFPTGTVLINGGAIFTNTPIVLLSLSCTDIGSGCTGVQVAPDGTADTEAFVPFAQMTTTLLSASDGPHTVAVRFMDGAGNVSSQVTDSILLDLTPPLVSIVSPTSGAILRGAVSILASATDALSGVAVVAFSVTDTASGLTTVLGSVTAPPYTVPWDTKPFADGLYTITARAQDQATNAASALISVTVDNNVFAIKFLDADPLTFNSLLSEQTSLSYELSESATVTVSIVDKATGATVRDLLVSVRQAGGVRQVPWDGRDATGVLVTGSFVFRVTGTDNLENTVTQQGTQTIQTLFQKPVVAQVNDSPDPFSLTSVQTTTISFTLLASVAQDLKVTIKIKDVNGLVSRALLTNRLLAAGPLPGALHSEVWDGRDDFGNLVQPGVYRYEIQASRVPPTPENVANLQTGTISVLSTRVTVSPDEVLTVLSHPETVAITIEPVPSLPLAMATALMARGSAVAGRVYAVSASGPLTVPILIQFQYEPSLFGKALIPVVFDPVSGRWAPVPFVLDPANHQLVLQVDRLGLLALLSNGDRIPPRIEHLLVSPTLLRFTLTDEGTGLDRTLLRVVLNGQDITRTLRIEREDQNREVEVEQAFPALHPTDNTLEIVAYDGAGNRTRRVLTFAAAFADADLRLTPEVLKVNDGVLTAIVRFPKELPVTRIETATLDGALVDRIVGSEDKDRRERDPDDVDDEQEKDKTRKKFTLKFRRTAIEQALDQVGDVLDTAFLLKGTAQGRLDRVTFEGRDTIRRIQ